MNALPFRATTSRTAAVRAALARMVEGAVFEIPSTSLSGRFTNVQKVISWRKGDGSLDLRTWEESIHKGATRWMIDAEGRLLDNGVFTGFWASDLRPTGENAMELIIANLPDDDDDEAPTRRVIPLRRES